MNRILAILGSAVFLVIAPGTIAVLGLSGFANGIWRLHCWASLFFVYFGVLLIASGLPLLLDSFARFAIQGLGTPAPVAPPRHFVEGQLEEQEMIQNRTPG